MVSMESCLFGGNTMNKLAGVFLFGLVSALQAPSLEAVELDALESQIAGEANEAKVLRLGEEECPPGYVLWGIGDNLTCVDPNERSGEGECPPGYVLWGIGDNLTCVDPTFQSG